MFDDHIDSREIDEIMIDQYKNLQCPMHTNRNTVSGDWLNGGFTKKNINPLVMDAFLRDKKNVGQLNSNYSDGEILIICKYLENIKKQGKACVYFDSNIYEVTVEDLLKIKDDSRKF